MFADCRGRARIRASAIHRHSGVMHSLTGSAKRLNKNGWTSSSVSGPPRFSSNTPTLSVLTEPPLLASPSPLSSNRASNESLKLILFEITPGPSKDCGAARVSREEEAKPCAATSCRCATLTWTPCFALRLNECCCPSVESNGCEDLFGSMGVLEKCLHGQRT